MLRISRAIHFYSPLEVLLKYEQNNRLGHRRTNPPTACKIYTCSLKKDKRHLITVRVHASGNACSKMLIFKHRSRSNGGFVGLKTFVGSRKRWGGKYNVIYLLLVYQTTKLSPVLDGC